VRRCPSGKVRYRSRLDAKTALASVTGKRRTAKEEIRFYWCELCSGLHLTSQEKRRDE